MRLALQKPKENKQAHMWANDNKQSTDNNIVKTFPHLIKLSTNP